MSFFSLSPRSAPHCPHVPIYGSMVSLGRCAISSIISWKSAGMND